MSVNITGCTCTVHRCIAYRQRCSLTRTCLWSERRLCHRCCIANDLRGGGRSEVPWPWLVVCSALLVVVESARCPRRRGRWAVVHVQMQPQPQPVCHAQCSVLPPGKVGGRNARSGAGTATSWRATAGGAKGSAPARGRRRLPPRLPPRPPAAPRAAVALAAAAAAAACAGRRPPAGRDPSGRPHRERCPRLRTRRSRRAPGRGRAKPALQVLLGSPLPCLSAGTAVLEFWDREPGRGEFGESLGG